MCKKILNNNNVKILDQTNEHRIKRIIKKVNARQTKINLMNIPYSNAGY